jgi:hypothetical protein
MIRRKALKQTLEDVAIQLDDLREKRKSRVYVRLPAPDINLKKKEPKDTKRRKRKIKRHVQQKEDKEDSLRLYRVNDDACEVCKQGVIKKDAASSLLVCEFCGNAETFLDCSFMSVGYDMDMEFQTFSYRRINHFTEWLNFCQGKEAHTTSEEVLREVMRELVRTGKRDPDKLDVVDVRLALKELRFTKLYENSPSIHAKLTGRPPPRFTEKQERLLKTMFYQIQKPFMVACPDNRKNFLSYSFCLHKFCELLGLKEYCPLFKLLKGREKLLKQDQIWKDICHQIGWRYFPSL